MSRDCYAFCEGKNQFWHCQNGGYRGKYLRIHGWSEEREVLKDYF